MRRKHALGYNLGHVVYTLKGVLPRAGHAKADIIDVAAGAVGHDRDEACVIANGLFDVPSEHAKIIGGHAVFGYIAHIVQRIIGQKRNRTPIHAAQ